LSEHEKLKKVKEAKKPKIPEISLENHDTGLRIVGSMNNVYPSILRWYHKEIDNEENQLPILEALKD
jgi:hypothetical protein